MTAVALGHRLRLDLSYEAIADTQVFILQLGWAFPGCLHPSEEVHLRGSVHQIRIAARGARHLRLAGLIDHDRVAGILGEAWGGRAHCLIAVVELLVSLLYTFALIKHLIDQIDQSVLVVLEAKVGDVFVDARLGKLGQVPVDNKKKRS